MWEPAPYTSKVTRRRPQSTLSYALQGSRKTRKRGSWYTLANSCTNFSFKISIPVIFPAQKPCRTSWRQIISLGQESIISSTTFHSNSNRLPPLVSVFPLGIRTKIVHPISLGISPGCHTNWVISTSFFHHSGVMRVEVPSSRYYSHNHFLKRSARSWLCPPDFCSWRCRTAISTPL